MTQNMPQTELTTESTVYVTYIASTPQKVWAALTASRFTKQFFFGRSVESDWKQGSPWLLRKPDGTSDVKGVVRECDPPHKLVVSWNVEGHPALQNLPESIVSYEIEPVGDKVVRLTMTEAHPTPIPAYLLEGGRRGWPMILSGLKSLLETGKPLEIPVPQRPQEK
jgi:uncharacterized protein YndB with AHSA1/START domain